MRSIQFLCLLALVNSVIWSAKAQDRIALVVGNSAYQFAAALPNPRNDAAAIGTALEDVGFDVTIGIDLDQRGMQEAFRDFGLKAETAEVAVVYFAGHGIQVADSNYLLPTDAQLKRERDLIYEATPLDIVMSEVAQARQLGIVILDACRDNPLAENLRQSLGPTRSKLIGQGMARVEDVPPDTLIAFSTRFNQVAYDGWGDLSPFTEALVKHLEEPGVELDLFFRKVRDTVIDLTAERQEPRTLDALGATPFYFRQPETNQAPVVAKHEPLVVSTDAGAVPASIKTPVDPDDDRLTVEIVGLPTFGSMEGAEGPVRFGDQLNIAQLTELRYRPIEDRTGSAGAFVFVVRDGRGGLAAGRLPIEVMRSNEPPSVAALQNFVWPRIPLEIEEPSDPDGDALSIKVLALPGKGRILDGDREIEIDDELSVDTLASLVLDPTDGVEGDFVYEVADGHGGLSKAVYRLAPSTANLVAAAETPNEKGRGITAEQKPQPAARRPDVSEELSTSSARDASESAGAEAPDSSAEVELALLETITASNIRNAPSASSGWVASVPSGAQLRFVEKVEGVNWYRIETDEGEEGFISGRLVRPIETEPAPGTPRVSPSPEPAPAVDVAALDVSSADEIDDLSEFRECDACPVMVALPEGRFRMGSADGGASERPVRNVTVDQSFAIGKFEVTVGQYQACVDAGYCNRIRDSEPGDADRPMQNVSWNDAERFAGWLEEQTGKAYRLPSESEWEYAARGGEATRFWWGDSGAEGRANCSECGEEWDRKRPVPIGSFEANPFGLHDMNGGVSEWVADCWMSNYQGAPDDTTARSTSPCLQRVLRGGSWRSKLDDITATSRFRYDAQVRYYTNGFRVARDLTPP